MASPAVDGAVRAGVDAVRADGGLVHIRAAGPEDLAALRDLHARLSDRSLYLRFFGISRSSADHYADLLARPNNRDHFVLVASVHDEIVGVANFDRVCATGAEQANDATDAEFALLLADDWQGEGIGTLLIEHLASAARHMGIRRFVGDVLNENAAMNEVLRNLGFELTYSREGSAASVGFVLDPTAQVIAAIDERDRAAEAASLTALLAPRTIAVVGAGTRPATVGHEVLANLLAAGFTGTVFAVNPKHRSVLGVRCVASPLELPERPDLVVVAVPARAVPDVVRQSGQAGARAILLLSAGFGELGEQGRELQRKTVQIAREYGMRLVGPNCVGVVNTDPAVRLNATFGRAETSRGPLGLLSQSGAFGLGFLEYAHRAGVGLSQFVSVGNKADVSGNDMLLYWEDDANTTVIGMYLESIKDAARFAHIARRVSRRKPILALKSGRTEVGRRAGESHTAAAATPEVAVDALFHAAGVIRMSTTQEFIDAARVLADLPVLGGPGVVIIGNSGGPGILAADAATAAGLLVVELDDATREAIAAAVPSAASAQNPIDLGAGAGPDDIAAALDVLLASPSVDAIITIFTEVAVSDQAAVGTAIAERAAHSEVPVVCVEIGAAERRIPLGPRRGIPVFALPEPAAAALGVAYHYSRIRSASTEAPSAPAGVDRVAARALIDEALAFGGGWLAPESVARVLRSYGIPVAAQRLASTADAAASAAAELGYPVVAKITGTLHKSDVGGVRLGIGSEAELRAAYDELIALSPNPVLLQTMVAATGREAIVGAIRHDGFGPLVMVGAGGTLADILDDRAFALAPLSPSDAAELIGGLRFARILDGVRGAEPASRDALSDLIVRVGALVSDFPEIAELDLNPVVCDAEADVVVDARVRVAAHAQNLDPLARHLHPVGPDLRIPTPHEGGQERSTS